MIFLVACEQNLQNLKEVWWRFIILIFGGGGRPAEVKLKSV